MTDGLESVLWLIDDDRRRSRQYVAISRAARYRCTVLAGVLSSLSLAAPLRQAPIRAVTPLFDVTISKIVDYQKVSK